MTEPITLSELLHLKYENEVKIEDLKAKLKDAKYERKQYTRRINEHINAALKGES